MRLAVVGYPLLAKRQWRLCSHFEATGVDTHIIVPEEWYSIPEADHPPSDAPFTVHHSGTVFAGRRGGYVLTELSSVLRRIEPDVVLTHGEPWFFGTLFTQGSAEWLDIPHVVFSWENLERVPQSPIQRLMERLALARVDGLVAGSDAAADRLRSRGFDGPIATAPQSGVDTDLFSPRPEGGRNTGSGDETTDALDRDDETTDALDRDDEADEQCTEHPSGSLPEPFDVADDERLVLYAGRFEPEKGIDTLLDTVPAVREAHENVRYLVIGEGSLEAQLRSRIASLPSEAVDLVPEWQPYDAMPEIYRRADVFVYPSETTDDWAEQFGYSVAEAMSCELPPVVTECGSLPWVVGDTGVVCPEADADALGTAISDLLRDDDRRATLGENARERVLSEFGLDSVAETQLSFLRDVAGVSES
jgi:glycosyltransferase involved in cell wall biosynthesis